MIIGGGPAGLSAAQYGARSALKTLLLEKSVFGGQALFIDKLENYPGNFTASSGFEVIEEFKKQALAFGAELKTGAVQKLKKHGAFFEAVLEGGEVVRAISVILAMGAAHRNLGIPGEEGFSGRGVSYCAACDGPFFKNKKIFVVGGGDAACDEANFLSRISSDITILLRGGEFRAQKALAERVLSNKAIKVRYWTEILELKGQEKLNSALLINKKTGEKQEEELDAVFIFAGINPNNALVLGELKVELDGGGFIKTAQDMQSSISGLYAAGDLRSSPFRQVITAAADGAAAAHAAASYVEAQKRA